MQDVDFVSIRADLVWLHSILQSCGRDDLARNLAGIIGIVDDELANNSERAMQADSGFNILAFQGRFLADFLVSPEYSPNSTRLNSQFEEAMQRVGRELARWRLPN